MASRISPASSERAAAEKAHPILDTSDRYRFCFGIHYEITPALPLKTIVAKISKLIKTLPSKLYAPP